MRIVGLSEERSTKYHETSRTRIFVFLGVISWISSSEVSEEATCK